MLINMLLPCVLAFLIGWLGARVMVLYSNKTGGLDVPGARSSHSHPTPTSGGVGVAVGVLAFMFWLGGEGGDQALLFIAGLGSVMCLTGWVDDRIGLSVGLRLLIQLLVLITMLLILELLPVLTLPGNVGLDGGWLLLVGVVAALWWVNLFNFMDGIDGLAASQALFMLCAASILTWLVQPYAIHYPAWQAMPIAAAAVLGFLVLNWPPARVFMGDTGSLFLGFLLVFFGLVTIMYGWMNYPAWMILGALFITDATVTLMVRLAQGQRLHQAHRSHAYQKLARRWGAHRPVTLLTIAINLLWLLPLAGIAMFKPAYAWLAVAVAYTPLLASVLWVGAGTEDHV